MNETPPRSWWTVVAIATLALLVAGIVAVGLRTSLGALRDAARAAHVEEAAAATYWIGVDGLIVVAIIAALILRHDPGARRYCLWVIGVFTVASGLLQYLHGLGWFTPDPRTGLLQPLPWGVVMVIALLVIGTIFCATHLFVHALRRLFPGGANVPDTQHEHAATTLSEASTDAVTGEPVIISPDPDPHDVAARVYRIMLDLGHDVGRDRLAKFCGITQSASVKVRRAVLAERELAELAAAELAIDPAPVPSVDGQAEPTDAELVAGLTPAEVLAGPGTTKLREQRRRDHAAANGTGE